MPVENTRSADDLIHMEEARKLGKIPSEKIEKQSPEPELNKQDNKVEEPNQEESEADHREDQKGEGKPQSQEESQASEDAPDEDEEVDEYGTPLAKEKMYTQAEVQKMIQDRLARGRTTEQQTQQAQEVAKDFKADPESEESWEAQLGDFVEKKISELAQKKEQENWREKEATSQSEFEDKFATGMTKYEDFGKVVHGKPITTSMMMATRSMQDPAAFLYAACKQQPAEIERISKITDPYAQVAEIGRLEERMKKARVISKAPAPSKKISGDATSEMPRQSIDELINSHAKSKIMNNRK